MPMLPTLFFLAMMQGDSSPSPTAPEILERMVQADNDRLAALAGYSGVRHYRFENKKTGTTAEMTVRMWLDRSRIEYSDYKTNVREAQARARAVEAPHHVAQTSCADAWQMLRRMPPQLQLARLESKT